MLFLFAGFWWALNRELTFPPEQRHFKFGYGLLFLAMAVLATFGILTPLQVLGAGSNALVSARRAIVIAVIVVFGYMLTELGHYRVFQRPKYTTWQEHLFFWVTLVTVASLGIWWSLK